MTWLQRQKRNNIALILSAFLLSSCSTMTTGYDGETLIMAIPDGCEKQWVDYYKCEMDMKWYQIFKECKMEVCDE